MSGEEIQKFGVKAVNKNTKLLKVKTTERWLNVFGREKIVTNADACVCFSNRNEMKVSCALPKISRLLL